MDPKKKAKLEAAGWKVGDYGDFLDLTPAEREVVELRVKLARSIRTLRVKAGMTQKEFAVKMGTTQPRVVKIERADKDVSMDVLVRGVYTLGGKVGTAKLITVGDDTKPAKKRVAT
jgi:predicted XRE-type DNA-binding protein